MKKAALLILFFLFSFSQMALGCSVPRSGPEYDSLVKIEDLGKNTFRAIFPKEAHGLNYGADVSVAYYDVSEKYRSGEYYKRVGLIEREDHYVVNFKLIKIEGYIPYVEVFWFPKVGGMCGAYGKSNDLLAK
jgi:hypothetical protein